MAIVVRLNAVTFPMRPEERALLAESRHEIREIEGYDDAEILARAADADAVMIVSAYLRRYVIDGLTRCRVVSRLGTGVDKIDRGALTRRGILLANQPHFSTGEVADHTLALFLTAARQLDAYRAAMRRGRRPNDLPSMHRLSAQTAGLVGFGNIAQAVARRLGAFGMKLLACDPRLDPARAEVLGVEAADFAAILSRSDYLFLLCPLTPENRGMMGRREFAAMRRTAVFINTARGELVDEPALAEALKEGVIRSAALDVFAGMNVFAPDGFPTDHPFFAAPNLIMTPHVAAYSEEAMSESHLGGAQAVVDVLSGRMPRHLVNAEVKPWFDIAGPERNNA